MRDRFIHTRLENLQKNMRKKNNGSEWNRKYDVLSWLWWLTIHIGKTPAKPSHHIDPR